MLIALDCLFTFEKRQTWVRVFRELTQPVKPGQTFCFDFNFIQFTRDLPVFPLTKHHDATHQVQGEDGSA